MDFMKGIVILVKVHEMYNILKSASHCLLIERLKRNWMIKVFAGVCPSIRLLRLSFNKGRLHLVRDTAAEKEIDIAIFMIMEHVSSGIQENRKGQR